MSKANHLIKFVTFGIDKKLRKEISVDPARVVSTEHYSDAFTSSWGESFPACTKIVLRDHKATFLVQGAHGDVVALLNGDVQQPQDHQPEASPAESPAPTGGAA